MHLVQMSRYGEALSFALAETYFNQIPQAQLPGYQGFGSARKLLAVREVDISHL